MRPPDLRGPFGRAWRAATPPDHPNAITTVASWYLHMPGQGIGWDRYVLSVVTLADLPGRTPPKRRYPGAEFELLVAALHPDPHPVPDDVETWQVMLPVNVVEQFRGINAAQAGELAEACVRACLQGVLMVETQVYVQLAGQESKMMLVKPFMDAWHSAVQNTVRHVRQGLH